MDRRVRTVHVARENDVDCHISMHPSKRASPPFCATGFGPLTTYIRAICDVDQPVSSNAWSVSPIALVAANRLASRTPLHLIGLRVILALQPMRHWYTSRQSRQRHYHIIYQRQCNLQLFRLYPSVSDHMYYTVHLHLSDSYWMVVDMHPINGSAKAATV